MPQSPKFLYVVCQKGAEPALKAEMSRLRPSFRFAFSRPGFLTYKLPENHRLAADFDLQSVFARTYGFSLGKATGESPDELIAGAIDRIGDLSPDRVHVFERDRETPGDKGFEPGPTEASRNVAALFAGANGRVAKRGELVLDCALVAPNEWWLGYHQARWLPSCWPGGVPPIEMPPKAVARAWLKMEEALMWSRFPIGAGARCVELGSAPGGASQALLARGCELTGIDPAEMNPVVLAHPNFRHLRSRARYVRRREFRKTRWLMADMNVAPSNTLDAIEEIVTHAEVHVRGMLLTLKLSTWNMTARIPDWLDRIRGWGFNQVRARQLAFNRREICVAALKKPFRRG
jgi:23S rRNA (cytidine2498-2'-O)-methyltransferase